MKKSRESSAQDRQVTKKKRDMRSREIDFPHIPELSGKQPSLMRRLGRPPLGDHPRKLIAIRIDQGVLNWIKRTAAKRGLQYQSLINNILAKEMKKAG